MFKDQLSEKKKKNPSFVNFQFVNFHSVNPPIMIIFFFFYFLFFHYEHFQAIILASLNTRLGRDMHNQFLWTDRSCWLQRASAQWLYS